MSEFDEFISTSLSEVIKKNLDPATEKKIKLSLFKKYGLSIKQSIKDFSKLNEVLKEELNSTTSIFEKKCLKEIITIKTRKNSTLIIIKDKNLINLMIDIFGDKEFRKILEVTMLSPLLISEIISHCNLPKTSGYRKVSNLIRNGILKSQKKEFTKKRRSIDRYSPIFQKLIFEINENQSKVSLELPTEILNQSSAIKIINP